MREKEEARRKKEEFRCKKVKSQKQSPGDFPWAFFVLGQTLLTQDALQQFRLQEQLPADCGPEFLQPWLFRSRS